MIESRSGKSHEAVRGHRADGLCRRSVVVQFRRLGSEGSAPAASAYSVATSRPVTAARPATGKGHSKKNSPATRSLDPSLRYDWLKASEDTKYEGKGRNIFMTQAEIPKPEGPGVTDAKKQENAGPPPPPPPPPINLKFFGFASKPGESQKDFLV